MALELQNLSKKLDFKGSGTSYNQNGFQTQTVTKYLRLALDLRWNSPLWEKLLLFSGSFLLVLTEFSFLREDLALAHHSIKFRHFYNISAFPKVISLKSFRKS